MRCRSAWLWLAIMALHAPAGAQPIPAESIPPALRPWMAWVVDEEPTYGCTITDGDPLCAWPGALSVEVTAQTGTFSQSLVMDRTGNVRLPGGPGQWPLEVRVDGDPVAVVEDDAGMPRAEITAGPHTVTGRFRFARPPEALPIAPEVARVDLVVGGRAVERPQRQADGSVWLRASETTSEEGPAQEHLSIEVYRRIHDGMPIEVTTHVIVRASGRTREVSLGRVLLGETVPASVSADLPIQLTRDGELRLQVRRGTWTIRIESLGFRPAGPFRTTAPIAPWPSEEVWVWQPSEAVRQVELQGAPSVDPERTSLPEDWKGLSAYLVRAGNPVTPKTLRRGDPNVVPNTIHVAREMRLDVDGRGYTMQDRVTGEMHRAHRLDLRQGELGRVSAADTNLLITKPPRGSGRGRGVELRVAKLDLTADWRWTGSIREVPAVGWSEDLQSLRTALHLPPGWSLLLVTGADRAPGTWLARWDVGPVFFVLLIAVVFFRLYGATAGGIALATMTLAYFEDGAPTFTWLAPLAAVAILRAFPKGAVARVLWLVWAVTSLVVLAQSIPFAAEQIRFARYPQLQPVAGGVARGGQISSEEQAPDWLERSGASSATRSQSDVAQDNVPRSPYSILDPSSVVQTGPGVPEWSHEQFTIEWTSPVKQGQRMHLYLVSPWMNALLAVLRVLGLAAMIVFAFRRRPGWPARGDAAPKVAAVAAGVLLLLWGALAAPAAHAQDVPTKAAPGIAAGTPASELLDELRERLMRPPRCAPHCVSVSEATVEVGDDTLRLSLVVHAGARAAFALPGPASQWLPTEVTVDGRATGALRLDGDRLSLRLEPGPHRVVLASSLAGRAELALSFPVVPRTIETRAQGWEVDGVNEDGVLSGSLQLRRIYGAAGQAEGEDVRGGSVEIPIWVELSRRFVLGPQWTIESKLRRVSSASAPAVLRVPLLAGESVTDAAVSVEGRTAQVSLGEGIQELTWRSVLAPADRLDVSAAPLSLEDATFRSSTWTFACSPIWSCSFEGLDPVQLDEDGVWAPTFRPYPGESLIAHVARPRAASGQATTIDQARLTSAPGARSTRSTLALRVRSSVSHTLRVALPRGADVHSVQVDGARRPIQRRGQTVEVGIVPGMAQVEIVFVESRGMVAAFSTPRVRVDDAAVNLHLDVELPSDRWLLWTSGPSWGPAILFWPHLVLILLAAFGLFRIPKSPLKLHAWLLLGLGLTQIPTVLALFVAGWFFAVTVQHRRWLQATAFNLAQVALAGYTFVAFIVLVGAVWHGLTVQPDMQVAGDGSHNTHLHWYLDRSRGTLPTATVVSVTIWAWKGLMLGWAAWLASSLVGWAKWFVTPFRENGFFVRVPKPAAPTPDAGPPPPAAQRGE